MTFMPSVARFVANRASGVTLPYIPDMELANRVFDSVYRTRRKLLL